MSGLDSFYPNSKFAKSNLEVYKSHEPENFLSALKEFNQYCERQLPKIADVPFIPKCFAVTKQDDLIVIGGEHGNIATFDIKNLRILRDEEISYEIAIESIVLALEDTQAIASNAAFEIIFLEFPSLEILYKSSFIRGPLQMKVSFRNHKLYLVNQEKNIKIINLSSEEDYYTKFYKVSEIPEDSHICAIEMSEDGSLLAIGSIEGIISVMHTDLQQKLKSTEKKACRPLVMAFSANHQLLAVAFEDHLIRVWNMDSSLSLKHQNSKHTDTITGLAFTRDDKYLISSSLDTLINVWDMKIDGLPYSMNIIDSHVNCLKASSDHKTVYYSQETENLMIWIVPQLPQTSRYSAQYSKVVCILFIPNTFDLVSIGEDGKLDIWDYRNHSLQDTRSVKGPLVSAVLTSTGSTILISTARHALYKWNYARDFIESVELTSVPVAISLSSSSSLVAISDPFSRTTVYEFNNFTKKMLLKGHLQPVISCCFISEDLHLITASKDCSLGKWEVSSGDRLNTMQAHDAPISSLTVSETGYIISGSEDGTLIFWSLDCVLLYILVSPEKLPINGIYLSQNHEYLIAFQTFKMSFWQLENLSLMFQVEKSYESSSFAVSLDECHIAVSEKETVFLEENPIQCNSLRIVGKRIGSPHKFMKFVVDCQKDYPKVDYDMNHNHWMIAPYQIGPAHILAYCNRFDDLNRAMFYEPNRAGFFSSIKDENPLSISVDMEFKICIDICLKYMKSESRESNGRPQNLKAYVPLAACLTKLNLIEYPYIAKLYNTMFIENHALYLPKFSMIEAKLPKLNLADHYTLYYENLIEKDMLSSTGRPIVFSQSTIPLDIDTGTYESINFLKSLLDCSEQEIFRSKIVQEYLQCKWEKIKPSVYVIGFTYILYLILLGLHIVIFLESRPFLILMIFVHTLLFLYEVLQVATDFGDYWSSTWNILDQLRSLSFSYYMIMAWQEEYNTDILLSVLIFSWSKGISCFRMFDNTRYMVRLIIQVIIDITTFFFMLGYATLAFAFVFYMRNPTKQPFPMFLTQAYRLDLGDFETNLTDPFDWFIFFISTMINPLIMLNLLIAIMSDTATAVDAIDDICGLRELTEMIVDVEKVMFWKKHLKHRHYLHKCDFVQTLEEETDKTAEKIKHIKRQVLNLEETVNTVKNTAEKLTKIQIEDHLNYISAGQQAVKGLMHSNFEKVGELISGIQKNVNKIE